MTPEVIVSKTILTMGILSLVVAGFFIWRLIKVLTYKAKEDKKDRDYHKKVLFKRVLLCMRHEISYHNYWVIKR